MESQCSKRQAKCLIFRIKVSISDSSVDVDLICKYLQARSSVHQVALERKLFFLSYIFWRIQATVYMYINLKRCVCWHGSKSSCIFEHFSLPHDNHFLFILFTIEQSLTTLWVSVVLKTSRLRNSSAEGRKCNCLG